MFRAAATAASVSRSSWSATRTQIARCGTGGEQRHWTRGHAAKEATIARAAVKEDCTFGVEARVRARAAVTEDCTFGVGGRAAMQRCISDLPDHVKTPKEVAFGVSARANYLADAVKNSNKSSFGLDARALSDRVDTVDLQGRAGIGDDPAKEVGVGLICTNKPAPHKVGIFALGKAGMPLSCATWNLKGGHSNVYSRPYSSFGGEQTQAQKDAEKEKEERRRREEEERGKRKEEDENLTFLLFLKRLLESILKKATEILNVDIKFTEWEKILLSLITLSGGLRLFLYKMVDVADNHFEARINTTFRKEDAKFEAWKTQQDLKRVRARTAAAIFRASEAENRRQEAELLTQLEERWLSDLGHSLFKLRAEIVDLKSIVKLLQDASNE